MASTQPFTSSPGPFKSVLAAIASFSPSPSSTPPCSGNSPVEGEKHTQFCAISPYECDTDSPSCYDSDSLLDFTGSSQLESGDTLDTSVSWYCRGDSAEENEDEAMHVTRSGDRTPLSPNNYLDSPAPLLDSKVFILHPIRLEDDDFDFTCAGLGEEEGGGGGEAYQVDRSRTVFRSHQVQPLHQRRHHHHHQPRRNATVIHNHNHNHNRPHPYKQPHVAQGQNTTSQLSTDRSQRRWSAPISAFADILAKAGFTTTTTGTSQTPVSSANPTSSDDDRDTDSDVDADSDTEAREETRGRASNQKELELYSVNKHDTDTQTQTLSTIQIPHKRRGSTLSTPRTWPRCRNSSAVHMTFELWDVADSFENRHIAFRSKPTKERSMTIGSFLPSNKWGNQPPNGYI